MRRLPMYQFNNVDSTGIDAVPINTAVLIIDSDGSGTPKEIVKIGKGTLTNASTITDFLADPILFSEFPSGAVIDEINGGTY